MTGTAPRGILDGIRVLDFGRYVAGPFCAAILGDLGADVIRVERPGGGEDRWTAPVGDDGTGAGFLQANRGKRGMTLRPAVAGGQEVLRRLAESADVLIANLPPSGLKALGLEYESLSQINPRLIVATSNTFGMTGPMANRFGMDTIAQAMSGMMHLTGEGEPMREAVPVVDFCTAAWNAVGVLAALVERGTSGRGQQVTSSLLRTAVNFCDTMLIEQALVKPNRRSTGNRSFSAAPSNAFATADGWIFVMVFGNQQFARWAELMGEQDRWVSDPLYGSDQERADHNTLLLARMREWCSQRSTGEALRLLDEARIPASAVYDLDEVLGDEQVAADNLLEYVSYPGLAGPAPVAAPPFLLSRTPGSIRSRAPMVGEHTDEILGELGFTETEITGLRADRVV